MDPSGESYNFGLFPMSIVAWLSTSLASVRRVPSGKMVNVYGMAWEIAREPSESGGFHKWGVPQNGWFIRENPIKMNDLGVPLF